MNGKRGAQARLMVLGALHQSAEPLMGYDLMKQCRVSSGRVYGTLMELCYEGKVERTTVSRLGRELVAYRLLR